MHAFGGHKGGVLANSLYLHIVNAVAAVIVLSSGPSGETPTHCQRALPKASSTCEQEIEVVLDELCSRVEVTDAES